MGFNPRARVGRDFRESLCYAIYNCFNPRARVGRDRAYRDRSHRSRVSIHAPAWGATAPRQYQRLAVICFNPRARVGRDKIALKHLYRVLGFNPRARVGRDLILRLTDCRHDSFNPRARVGRDRKTEEK